VTGKDTAGRLADACVSAAPFAAVGLLMSFMHLTNSEWLLGQLAVFFWTTSNRKGWL